MRNLGSPLPILGGGTGAATAAAARANLGLNSGGAESFRNRLRNGGFWFNQRGAASASTSYAASAYVLDGWKAGANGVTLSFAAAANGDVTVTITAGTLLQIVEGVYLLREGGSFVLSWTGTATARVYQGAASGSYAASPVAASGLTAGTNTTVEFGTGTLTLVQFEPGTSPTVFERRDDEERRCLEYYWRLPGGVDLGTGFAVSTSQVVIFIKTPVRMRSNIQATFSSIQATDNGLIAQTMTGIGATAAGRDQYRVTFSGPSSFTFGQGSLLIIASAGSAAFTCEL